MSGDKYNNQIKVVSLNDEGLYKFIIPAKMEGLDDLEITLGYSRTDLEGFKLMEESESHKLDFSVVEKSAVGVFTISNKGKLQPYLHVMWWPKVGGLCGVVANSDFIGASNT
jgi:hypothetical protein